MQVNDALTRRKFLTSTSCLGAALALARPFSLPALAESLQQDKRVAEQPLVDKGFASVRRVGAGVYSTISDFSKGLDTLCNGGFLVGNEAALLIEGFRVPAGAAFQLEALRSVSQVPVRAAVDTHYHFDHSMGNAHYGDRGIPVWAHAKASPLMVQNYANLQGQDKAALLEPVQKRIRDAANESERQRAQGDLNAYTLVFQTIDSTMVALPNHPLDPAKLPATLDLSGIKALIETYPGHTPTDVVVRVPEQNIIFTGDLLFNAWYPVTFDADISAWRATLGKFAGFGKDALFVPGHGQLCGQEGIALFRTVFDDLAEHASKMYKAGVPVEEAQKRYVVPERFNSFVLFAWSFTVAPTIAKLYEEFKAGKT
jgi:glyoxylase-like metal-dependent hydrolase (beta-lactamase superfamily II)